MSGDKCNFGGLFEAAGKSFEVFKVFKSAEDCICWRIFVVGYCTDRGGSGGAFGEGEK